MLQILRTNSMSCFNDIFIALFSTLDMILKLEEYIIFFSCFILTFYHFFDKFIVFPFRFVNDFGCQFYDIKYLNENQNQMEEFQIGVFLALCLEWLGTNLLVTTTITTVDRAQRFTAKRPFGAIHRETCGMTEAGTQYITTHFLAG